MIVLSWNVRGIRAFRKRGVISYFISQFKPSIAILQETKCQEMFDAIIKELWSNSSIKWVAVNAEGNLGGILVAWDSTLLASLQVSEGRFSLGLQFRDLSLGKIWCVGGLYGPTRYRERGLFWEKLSNLFQSWRLPWLFVGDFNAIRYCSEKRPPANCISASMRGFSDFIGGSGLDEIPLSRKNYTWSNNQHQPILSKLDRFLACPGWLQLFGNVSGWVLNNVGSDHWPIMLTTSFEKWGRCPFWFENSWLSTKNFEARIDEWWAEGPDMGRQEWVFPLKLRIGASFIVLVPKKQSVEKPEDFRPISLSSSAYKIIARILAHRLKALLLSVIHKGQGAFLKRREILDSTMAAHELIDHFQRNKDPRIALKVDLEKAFDRVNWILLDEIMEKMGFGNRWRFWIRSCVGSASYSLLINGSVCGYFKGTRGIRQGDPLSPLLFNMIGEFLSAMFYSAGNLGWLPPTSSSSAYNIPILQYADDTIIFGVGTTDCA
ncbi:uncharacterized protein [Aristolochia californica]|uniref:uncharacterized protein n=1 Tax=Aristolochia californica TaxID=171875 RepID=UPI0035DBF47C